LKRRFRVCGPLEVDVAGKPSQGFCDFFYVDDEVSIKVDHSEKGLHIILGLRSGLRSDGIEIFIFHGEAVG